MTKIALISEAWLRRQRCGQCNTGNFCKSTKFQLVSNVSLVDKSRNLLLPFFCALEQSFYKFFCIELSQILHALAHADVAHGDPELIGYA